MTNPLPAVVTIVDLTAATAISSSTLFEAVQTTGGTVESVKVSLAQIMTTGQGALPTGGSTSQLLQKASGTNFASQWVTVSAGTSLAASTTGAISFGVVNFGIDSAQIATFAIGSSKIATNAVGSTQFRQSPGLSVVGVASTVTGNVIDITASTSGLFLQSNATSLLWTTIIISAPYGLSSYTTNGVLFGNGTSNLGATQFGTTGMVLQGNGSAAAPGFALVNLGSSATVTGIVALTNGGTGTSTPSFGSVTNFTAGGGLATQLGTTGGTISTTGQLLNVRYPGIKTALYTALVADLGSLICFSAASIVSAIIPQAAANVGSSFGPGWFVDLVNFGGTTVIVAPLTSNLTGIAATTGLGPNQSIRLVSDGTNYQVPFASGPLALSRVNTAQSFSGGVRVVSFSLGTFTTGNATCTLDSGKGPLQFATNSGAMTFVAPSNDGEIDVLLLNGAGAGAVSFAGFNVGTNTGDTYTTTATQRFVLMSRTINASSTYAWKALQ